MRVTKLGGTHGSLISRVFENESDKILRLEINSLFNIPPES